MFHMNTDRLRAFCTIVETGSMTKAAELLGISHSGLSKAIAQLQHELGYAVFRPVGRGLELMAEGRDTYNQSRRILELVNELKTPRSTESSRPPRLGFPEALALAISRPLADEIGPITLDEYDTGELENEVAEGRFDFGFTFIPHPRPDIEHLKVSAVTLRSFQRKGAFDNQDPDTIPYVVPSAGLKDNPLSLKIRDGWNPRLTRQVAFRANTLAFALEMARSGRCALYAPTVTVEQLNRRSTPSEKLEELSLPPKRRTAEVTKRNVYLVKRKTEAEGALMKQIARIVRQTCAGN